jgi:predicted ester cyclase
MNTEQNKQLIQRLYASFDEFFQTGDARLLDQYIAPDLVNDGEAGGLAAVKENLTQWRAVFPDWRETPLDVIAEGEKAVVRFVCTGTHQGKWMGLAPTGRQVTVNAIDILRIAQNKVVERWSSFDLYGLLQQLGTQTAAEQHK